MMPLIAGVATLLDASTLASHATVASAAFLIGGGFVGGAWRFYVWRREHGAKVSVEISFGFPTFAPVPLVVVTVHNPFDHPVSVSSVAIEMNDGSRRVAIEPWRHRGATVPGVVNPHDTGMTWFDFNQLVEGGLKPEKPVRARVVVGGRPGFVWSRRRRLSKQS
jgi:hypothetical protein